MGLNHIIQDQLLLSYKSNKGAITVLFPESKPNKNMHNMNFFVMASHIFFCLRNLHPFGAIQFICTVIF